jgi:Tetratricopeptide repeat
MVRSYMKLEANNDALVLINYLEDDKNFPKRLKGELNILSAEMHLANSSNEQAIASIQEALKKGKFTKSKKQRLNFLLGQLHQRNGDFKKSNTAFEKVLKTNPDLAMDFYAKLYLAKNTALMPNGDLAKVENVFQKIINDGKYTEYLDKAYLTLGQLQSSYKQSDAIKNFEKSIKESKSDATKAEAMLAIADIHFNNKNYASAKVGYDSTLEVLSSIHLRYQEIDSRRSLLQDLIKELNVIAINDSLLALSALSEKEQIKIAKKAIRKKNKEKAAGQIVENPIVSNVSNAQDKGSSTQDKNWYFNNAITVGSGKDKFTQKWGSRPNVDNWRRLAAASNAIIEVDKLIDTSEVQNSEEEIIVNADLETYLAAIPNTQAKKDFCLGALENSYYNAAAVFFAGLNNYPKAIFYIDTLLSRFPNTSFKEQGYYTQYLSHLKWGHKMDAENSLQQITALNPTSKLLKLARDTAYASSILTTENDAVAYYDATYDMFKGNKFSEVLPRVTFARDAYKENKLIPKFELLNAMSLASLKKMEDAKSILNDVIQNYTGKEEATFAQDLLLYLSKSDTSSSDSTINLDNIKPSYEQKVNNGTFVYNPSEPHYFLFILNVIDDKLYPTRAAFNDYNNLKNSSLNLESSLSLINAKSGLLVFKTFPNLAEAKKYQKLISNEKIIYANFKNNEYDMAIISESNFALFQQTRNLESYLKFYKLKYK